MTTPYNQGWEACHCGTRFKKYRPQHMFCSYRCLDAARYYRNREKRLERQKDRVGEKSPEEIAEKTRADFAARNPEKAKARQSVRNAIARGVLQRLPCEECGKTPTHAHHYRGYDVENIFTIQWLCRSHHYKKHRSKYGYLGN